MNTQDRQNCQHLLQKIIHFQNQNDQYLIQKYSKEYLLEQFDRPKLEELQRLILDTKQPLDIIQFVRLFLNIIEHQQHQTLYIAVGLLDLYNEISKSLKKKNISYQDLTNYVCQKIFNQNETNMKLQTKQMSKILPKIPDYNRISELDLNAPIVNQQPEIKIKKVIKGKIIADKSNHTSKKVKTGCIARNIKKIIILDNFSSFISIFDYELNPKMQLCPSILKNSPQIIIVDITYSELQKRIGCIMKYIGLCFWDHVDNYKSQKIIYRNGHRIEGIAYLPYFKQWITYDLQGLCFWNLLQESPKMIFKSAIAPEHITCVEQIVYKKLIAVSYNCLSELQKQKIKDTKQLSQGQCFFRRKSVAEKRISLWNFSKQTIIIEIEINRFGTYILKFIPEYQVLLSLGYQIFINFYQIHQNYDQINKIGRLAGHASLVTAVGYIKATPMVISSDDTGIIKIWDIRYFRCVQTIDLGKRPLINKILDLSEQNKLVFLDSRINFLFFEYDKQLIQQFDQIVPFKVILLNNNQQIIVVTRHQLRFINLKNGSTNKIYKIAYKYSQEIISCSLSANQQCVIVGNQQGQVNFYQIRNGQRIESLRIHSAQISSIKYDYKNQLYLFSSYDSNFEIYTQHDIYALKPGEKTFQVIRKSVNNFNRKPITICQLSVHHNIIVIGSTDQLVCIWNYQYLRLQNKIKMLGEPVSIKIEQKRPVIFIGSSEGHLTVITFQLTDNNSIKCVLKIEMIFVVETLEQLRIDKNERRVTKKITALRDFFQEKKDKQSKEEQKQSIEKLNYQKSNNFPTALFRNRDSLYVGMSEGDLLNIQLRLECQQTNPIYLKSNYNAMRNIYSNYIQQEKRVQTFAVQNNYVPSAGKPNEIWRKKVHKNSINYLALLSKDVEYLISCSLDGSIKITEIQTGEILCNSYLKYPLPFVWKLKLDNREQQKKKVIISMNIIHYIFMLYKNCITVKQARKLTITNFIEGLTKNVQKKFEKLPQLKSYEIQRVKIMKDQFTIEDLKRKDQEGNVKSIKEMEAYKRINKIKNDYNNIFGGKIKYEQLIKRSIERTFVIDIMEQEIKKDKEFENVTIGKNFSLVEKMLSTSKKIGKKKNQKKIEARNSFKNKNNFLTIQAQDFFEEARKHNLLSQKKDIQMILTNMNKQLMIQKNSSKFTSFTQKNKNIQKSNFVFPKVQY